jgi:hypothetical protein
MNTKQLLQLHEDTCKSCRAIMEQKNSDYTGGKSSTDPFANFNASSILGIHPVQGLLLRVIDKIQRIRSFTNDKELKVSNESVEDACDDIVNYAILAKAMLMEERSQIESENSKLPTGEQEIEAERRMNIIGQNGNEGLHYSQIEQNRNK